MSSPLENPSPRIAVSDAVVDTVAGQLTDISADTVRQVIQGLNTVRGGDPVGTVRRDDATGAVATRVDDQGLHIWRVNSLDGTSHNDLQPTLAWTVIHEAPAADGDVIEVTA